MLNREQELKHIQSLPDGEKKFKKLEELVQKYSNYTEAYFELALISVDLGKLDKGRKCYEKAIELNPRYEPSYNNLALLLRKKHFSEYQLARKYYEKVIELNPSYSIGYMNYAALLAEEPFNEYETARGYFQRAIELNPTNADAYNNLGNLLVKEQLQEYEQARKNYEKAIELNPEFAVAYTNLANVLVESQIKEFELARKYYEKSIKLNPSIAYAYFNLALLLSSEHYKEYALARKYYEKAIEINSGYAETYDSLANLLTESHFKEFELARKYYEKSIELNPMHYGTYNNLAILLTNEHFKEYKDARRYYEKAIELNPNNAIVYMNLAVLLSNENFKEYEESRKYLKQGLEIDPNSAHLHSKYAELLANYLKDKESAKYHFCKAIELNKDSSIFESARHQLKQLAFEGNKPSFINQISLSRILHLKELSIEVDSKDLKHLLITGHNGCGKTILLNRISDYLQKLIDSKPEIAMMNGFEKDLDKENPSLLSIQPSSKTLYYKYRSGFFVIAHFEARRNLKLAGTKDVENIQLPTYTDIKSESGETNYTNTLFLKYAVNQYVQSGLAARDKDETRQREIDRWIANFENIVKTIDDRVEKVNLVYKPNYYFEFIPRAPYEKFTFEQLADGFASIFSIVAELILRMANKTLLSYEVEGLVLLDEPEAHLHLDVQKKILPMLTKLFPKVQFIVATHSPFILSSLENAVVYDLEKQWAFDKASQLSYSGLVENFFKVNSEYSTLFEARVKRYEELAEKGDWTEAEEIELAKLDSELSNVSPLLSPDMYLIVNRIHKSLQEG